MFSLLMVLSLCAGEVTGMHGRRTKQSCTGCLPTSRQWRQCAAAGLAAMPTPAPWPPPAISGHPNARWSGPSWAPSCLRLRALSSVRLDMGAAVPARLPPLCLPPVERWPVCTPPCSAGRLGQRTSIVLRRVFYLHGELSARAGSEWSATASARSLPSGSCLCVALQPAPETCHRDVVCMQNLGDKCSTILSFEW